MIDLSRLAMKAAAADTAASLADYLALLLPPTADALIGPAAFQRLTAQAAVLPPIPRIAVECRLAAEAGQVDLQLCLRREEGDYERFARHAADLARSQPANAAAVRLSGFAARLADSASALARGVLEVFLEYDLPEGADVGRSPAVFVSLPVDPVMAHAVILDALSLLRPTPAPPALLASIAACFAACEEDATVSHLGVMTGRPVDAVRLNVKGLRPAQLGRFLEACRWTGDRTGALNLFDSAVDAADRVTLALDVGETLLPRIGVECFVDVQPRANPAWRARLDELCRAGLCAPEKAEAFLQIPDDMAPGSGRPPWPADLMIQSLLAPDNEFTVLARRVVHWKVTESPDGRREAKAYFGAGVLTFRPGDAQATRQWRPTLAAPRPRRSLANIRLPGDPIERAAAHGVIFLLHAQLQSGLWRDFHVPTGVSDEWVSGFIGAQLASTGDPRARLAAHECLDRLKARQRDHGGWGYNGDHPCDADSTAWALRLALALGGEAGHMQRRGEAFIAGHCRPDGALATFVDHDGVVAITGLPQDASLAGWLHVHDCVTAAAAPFLPERSVQYLRGRQELGAWTGYWWDHQAYPTWMAVEALRARPERGDDARLAAAAARARGWIDSAAGATGGVASFDVACALRILLCVDAAQDRDAAEAAGRWLADHQTEAGGWAPGAALRIPAWRRLDPEKGGEMICLDRRAAFTSAAATGALAQLCATRGLR